MNFTLECEQEADGRWIAEVPELPGVHAYGTSSSAAMAKAEVLALRVIAERIESGELSPSPSDSCFHSLHESLAFGQSQEGFTALLSMMERGMAPECRSEWPSTLDFSQVIDEGGAFRWPLDSLVRASSRACSLLLRRSVSPHLRRRTADTSRGFHSTPTPTQAPCWRPRLSSCRSASDRSGRDSARRC